MEQLSKAGYYKKCEAIAQEIMQEIAQEGNSWDDCNDRLFERVNDSQYIIYTYYHLQIIQLSDNDNYGADNGLMGNFSDYNDFSDICQAVAFWAMYADIQDCMNEDDFNAIVESMEETTGEENE